MDHKNMYDSNLQKLIEILSAYTELHSNEIKLDSHLMLDLGLTSFDFVCLSASLEELGINLEDKQIGDLETVRDIYQLFVQEAIRV